MSHPRCWAHRLYECKSSIGPLPKYHRRAAYMWLLHSLSHPTPMGGRSVAGNTTAFPPACTPAWVDSCLRSEHSPLTGRERSEGSQSSQLQPAHCEGAAVGVHCVMCHPHLPWHRQSRGLTPRRQGLRSTRSHVCLAPCLLLCRAEYAFHLLQRNDQLLSFHPEKATAPKSSWAAFTQVRKAGGRGKQSMCNYVNTSLLYPLEYLKFLATYCKAYSCESKPFSPECLFKLKP